jgi:hypothetical protein
VAVLVAVIVALFAVLLGVVAHFHSRGGQGEGYVAPDDA